MKEDKDTVEIVQDGNPVLRTRAKDVPIGDIKSAKIKKVINDMQIAMQSQKDAIAIAAPQIGVSLRIFVVSDKMLKEVDKRYKSTGSDMIFINPEIIKVSRDRHETEEGCLSVRWKYGKVKRAKKVTIKGYNEKAELVKRGASDLLAQIFQHETEHLDGTLFIDKAYDVEDMPPKIKSDEQRNK